jgi:hypothetical protein
MNRTVTCGTIKEGGFFSGWVQEKNEAGFVTFYAEYRRMLLEQEVKDAIELMCEAIGIETENLNWQ